MCLDQQIRIVINTEMLDGWRWPSVLFLFLPVFNREKLIGAMNGQKVVP